MMLSRFFICFLYPSDSPLLSRAANSTRKTFYTVAFDRMDAQSASPFSSVVA